MKLRNNNYEVVTSLPGDAINVATLADELNCTTAYIYKLYKLDKLRQRGYDIVIYNNYNFAIPVKNTANVE